MPGMYFELTTPERVLERDEIVSVTAMTVIGEVTILPGHIPYTVPLVSGIARVRKSSGAEEEIAVLGGFLQVQRGADMTRVTMLADAAERAEDIDEKRAEEARKRAREALDQYRNIDTVKFTEAAAAFERALARLALVRRKRTRATH